MSALLLALLLQATAFEPVPEAALPRVTYGAMTWKIVLVQAGDVKKDVWGGRVTLNARVAGKLHGVLRVDASALPGDEFVATDPDTYKAIEGYGGLYYDATGAHDFSAGPALIGGLTHGFDLEEGEEVKSYPQTYGAGVRLGLKGAWLYMLAAKHEAAGPGVRLLVATQIPVWQGMTLVLDFVSGEGGFVRAGVGYAFGAER